MSFETWGWLVVWYVLGLAILDIVARWLDYRAFKKQAGVDR